MDTIYGLLRCCDVFIYDHNVCLYCLLLYTRERSLLDIDSSRQGRWNSMEDRLPTVDNAAVGGRAEIFNSRVIAD